MKKRQTLIGDWLMEKFTNFQTASLSSIHQLAIALLCSMTGAIQRLVSNSFLGFKVVFSA